MRRRPRRFNRTCGRVSVKTKNSSGSIEPKRVPSHSEMSTCAAVVADSPESFHPSKAITRMGLRSGGMRWSERCGECLESTMDPSLHRRLVLIILPSQQGEGSEKGSGGQRLRRATYACDARA